MASTIIPDLQALAQAASPVDLRLTWEQSALGRSALKVAPTKDVFAQDDSWLLPIPDVKLANGVIEFEALGQSHPPQSNFIGVAFRVADHQTYDAIYARPFNFRAEDPVRRIHAVQYISHPDFPWFDLRSAHPGQYEQPVSPAPDGDSWFVAKVVLDGPSIRVFINGGDEPSLDVEELAPRTAGGVAIWVGPGLGGYVRNLRIRPTQDIATSRRTCPQVTYSTDSCASAIAPKV